MQPVDDEPQGFDIAGFGGDVSRDVARFVGFRTQGTRARIEKAPVIEAFEPQLADEAIGAGAARATKPLGARGQGLAAMKAKIFSRRDEGGPIRRGEGGNAHLTKIRSANS